MSSATPVILITGSSTGFGRCLALEALAKGMRVLATARRLSSIEDLATKGAKIIALDVTSSPETLKKTAHDAIAAFGHIDILVNNAGYLLAGVIEELSTEEVQSQFNINFFSVLNVTNAFLPHFRARKAGTIVNISSQGAYVGRPGGGIYSATKAALDSCISETLSKELEPWNIRVTAVNLGTFRTMMSTNFQRAQNPIECYEVPHKSLEQFAAHAGQERGDATKAAKKLLDIIALENPLPPFVVIGDDAVPLIKSLLGARLKNLEEWKEYGLGTSVEE